MDLWTALCTGAVVAIIYKIKIKTKNKQLFSNIAFVISIPIMIIKYIDVSSGYAWAVSLILMLVAVAFNQLKSLYWIEGATYATLIWRWVKAPVLNMTFSTASHLSRIIFMTIIL